MKSILAVCALLGAVTVHALDTQRASTTAVGGEATGGNSFAGSISADGNLVAFSSLATNLDPADSNSVVDVYLKNLSTGAITLVSRGANGVGTASSNLPSISADGRFVAFVSASANLVANDTNGVSDVFVYNVASGTLEIGSVNSAEVLGNGNSGAGNCGANCFSLSDDGRYLAFESLASNLAAPDTDTVSDIFVRDLVAGTTVMVSKTSAGALGTGSLGSNRPAISGNGRFVAFESSRVLEAGDSNNTGDIYLHDLQSGSTIRVNTSAIGGFTTTGFSARPSISIDGTVVAFRSLSNELVPNDTSTTSQRDVFVKNTVTGAIRRAEAPGGGDPNGDSNELFIDPSGKRLVFHSVASNLVANDSNAGEDVFLMTLSTGAIERVSLNVNDEQANGFSTFPECNLDCGKVVYESTATNLVANDGNARTDVFVTTLRTDLLFSNGFE